MLGRAAGASCVAGQIHLCSQVKIVIGDKKAIEV